jgi:protein-S-isoprenylcysteine O-methyltransferase Ste14
MHALKLAIGGAWIVFWIYWLASASVSKQSVAGGWRTRLTGVSVVGVFVISGVLRGSGLAVPSVLLAAIGAVLFACGTVEERNLTATFPTAYPEFASRTKMLHPFLL